MNDDDDDDVDDDDADDADADVDVQIGWQSIDHRLRSPVARGQCLLTIACVGVWRGPAIHHDCQPSTMKCLSATLQLLSQTEAMIFTANNRGSRTTLETSNPRMTLKLMTTLIQWPCLMTVTKGKMMKIYWCHRGIKGTFSH